MPDHLWFRDEPWYDDEIEDYCHAKNDDERRQMLLIFGVDDAHRSDAERLFNPPEQEPAPLTPAERIELELKQVAQQMSDQQAEQEKEKRSEQLQAAKDKKQGYRHDFKVAVFSILAAFALEHFQDILNLIQEILRFFSQ